MNHHYSALPESQSTVKLKSYIFSNGWSALLIASIDKNSKFGGLTTFRVSQFLDMLR